MGKLGQKHTSVTLIDVMGDDQTVVKAARVSFNKSDAWNSERDTKLIKYLAEHNHWSPFSHCFATFRITAPIFVARQLGKHQVGLAWNEVSRRYVDDDVEFHIPDFWRGRPSNKKQGSHGIIDDTAGVVKHTYEDALRHCNNSYNALLNQGVAPEQARAILPQAMMTSWYWSGSLYAFARVCNLRQHADAQYETEIVAGQISYHLRTKFPVSWKVLVYDKSSD